MTTDLVRHDTAALSEKIEWSRAMAPGNLLPRQYQGNPANLLFAVEYADALGVERINAITSIHVIEGKPSASAELIAALVRRAGHKLRVTGDDQGAQAVLIRADDPEFEYVATWTMDRARSAGLAGKAVWKNYPAAMLRARAITEVARMGASDAVLGLVYTPEELGAETDGTGVPVAAQKPPAATPKARLTAALRPEPETVEVVIEDPPADEPEPDGVTRSQLTALHAALTAEGFTDRQTKLDWCSRQIGRDITSSSQLTKAEASSLLDLLKGDA